MPTNNTALYDAVIAGIASSNNAWLYDPLAANYADEANVAAVIATKVDSLIPVIVSGATISQRVLMESISKGVMSGRMPQSLVAADYDIAANAIAALFTQMNTKLQNNSSGAVPAPSVTQQVFVSSLYGSNVTGDGTEDNPYLTIAFAQSTITDESAAKIYEITLLPGEYVENVALLAFTRLVGSDPSKNSGITFPCKITGDVTLGASFGIANAIAYLTNIEIDGLVTLDFVTAVSVTGVVTFASCLCDSDVILIMNSANQVEFHESILLGAYTQTGGDNVTWYNTTGASNSDLLSLIGVVGSNSSLILYNSNWDGDVTLDQNGVAGVNVFLGLINSSAFSGDVTINASAADSPRIISNYGDLRENVTLAGAAAALEFQMRIIQQFSINAGTAIAATSVTVVPLAITANKLGVTLIENMISNCSLVGNGWDDILDTHDCSVTVQYKNPNVINICIYNPGAGFNTAAGAVVNFGSYLPNFAP